MASSPAGVPCPGRRRSQSRFPARFGADIEVEAQTKPGMYSILSERHSISNARLSQAGLAGVRVITVIENHRFRER
jgi:hypothetical protein